jgi:RNA 2',3'-cyclic 3'-phosphodiesterase
MENKRLFISLPVDPGLAKNLIKQFERLDIPHDKLKSVLPEQLHLTVKFLGDTPLDKIDQIIEALENACDKHGNFDLVITKPQIFPITDDYLRPARVLSLGLEASPQLQELYDKIEEGLWQAGLAHKENRKFTPHLTLARVKQSTMIKELENFLTWPVTNAFAVDYLQLQESILDKKGPQHIVLNTSDL